MQVACEARGVPEPEDIARWVKAVIAGLALADRAVELTVRVVGEAEGVQLNRDYRHGAGATNVLSFPFAGAAALEPVLLGDVVICAPVVRREAAQQGKEPMAHWAHMVVHGTLHLLGYDHLDTADAERMEALEKSTLKSLGFSDPYRDPDTP